MKYQICALNSLDTVFWDSKNLADNLSHASFLRNEAFSYQLAFLAEFDGKENTGWNDVIDITAEIESDISDAISLYSVENVPVSRVGYSTADDWFLRKEPGLYPDCMHCLNSTKTNEPFFAVVGQAKTLWVNINEKGALLPVGKHHITIRLFDCRDGNHSQLAESTVTVEVLSEALPKQKMIFTNWVHYDCIAHFSGTKPFSDAFYAAAESYIRAAAQNGQNMIFFPAFTPPLDTPVGEERMTVQLIDVTLKDGKYSFDFSEARRFITLCLSCGIEYFEHSHLYTQWGARHAPKIIVRVNGKKRKYFGWDTDAHGRGYHEFLHSYLTAFKAFLKEIDCEKRFFFHVSDEPTNENIESYKKASDFLHKELSEFPSGDALSEYEFYEQGLVKIPIPVTRTAHNFIGKAEPLWLYYTGGECNEYLSNRLIGMPKERGRVLGVQLYYVGAEGFLNWAFNAHHNRLSRKLVDPRISADMGSNFVGGTSYLVYPNDNGGIDPSVRLMTFRDQTQDVRAFEKLEALANRETVLDIIKKHIPDISLHCRVTAEQLFALRDEVNLKIIELSAK